MNAKFDGQMFEGFNVLEDHSNDVLTIMWRIKISGEANSNYLAFYFGMQNYPIHKGRNLDGIKKPITCVIMKQ
jgi:hypothetical protein